MSSPFFHATVGNKPQLHNLRKKVSVISFSKDTLTQTFCKILRKTVCSKRFQLFGMALALCLCGVGAVMTQGGLDFITACYVMAQVVTTVGYGDITPRSDVAKLCVSAYSLVSLVVIAYVLNDLMSAMMEWQEQYVAKSARTGDQRCSFLRDETLKNLLKSTLLFFAFLGFGTVFYRLQENCTCGYRGGSIKSQFVQGCDPSNYDSCVATGGITKSFIDTFYMSVITLTSVGFGDYRPDSQRGRIVAIFWMPVGVAVTGKWVSSVTAFLFERKRQGRESVQDADSLEEFAKSLDSNEDGELTRGEHHLYWLVTKGLISREALADMDASYKQRFGSRTSVCFSEISFESTSVVAPNLLTSTENKDKADLALEKENLVSEKDDLAMEKDDLASENDNSALEKPVETQI
jgi:hypothetical protein